MWFESYIQVYIYIAVTEHLHAAPHNNKIKVKALNYYQIQIILYNSVLSTIMRTRDKSTVFIFFIILFINKMS